MGHGEDAYSAGRELAALHPGLLATAWLGILRGVLSLGLALGFASCQGSAEQAPDMGSACLGIPPTGRCLDRQTLATCVVVTNGEPSLVQNTCAAGYTCVSAGDQSSCKLTSTCREGQTRCSSTSVQQLCQGGVFQDRTCLGGTECRTFPGLGGNCILPGSGVTAQGTLHYERRQPNASLSGYTAPAATAAAGVFIALVDGSEVLGSGFSNEQGQFTISGYRAPGAGGQVIYIPLAFFPDDGPAYGVAIPSDGATSTAPAMWSFSTSNLPAPQGGVIPVGTQIIRAENSGAMHIFSWLRTHLARAATVFGSAQTSSVAVLWKPGVDSFCLACFLNRTSGGTDVGGGLLPLHFDTTILLSGSDENPLQWSSSIINHELGHFVMGQYSRPPGEVGVHYLSAPESPGLAFSEGYATWDGQAALSAEQPTPNPIYFAVQQGTAFYIDLSSAMASSGMIPLPDPRGSIDQQIGEIAVASIAWDLWRNGGDIPVLSGIALPRVTSGLNRGYKTVDLVDFADALLCGGRVSAQQMNTSMSKYGFPWDNQPLCP